MKNILSIILAVLIAGPACAADYTRATTTQSINTYTPTTGGTVTLTRSNDTVAVINPATDIAALTIAMPTSPKDGDRVTINATKSVAAVTFSGGTVTNAPVAFVAGNSFSLINVSGTWKPLNGPSSTGALNLRDFGLPTGGDDTAALNAVFASAKAQGRPVEVPCGTYNHLSTLTIDSIAVRGQGLCSIINSTDPATTNPQSATYIRGDGVEVSGLNFGSSYSVASRSTQIYSAALAVPYGVGATLTNFKVANNYFTGYFAGPFFELSYAGEKGVVSGNIFSGTAKANPIIFQAPVSKVEVIGNVISGDSGDTCIELVDYTNQDVSTMTDINIVGNSVSDCAMLTGAGGHGISVVGGDRINISSNTINRVANRGIYIAGEDVNNTSSTNNINLIGNSIEGAAVKSADTYILVVGRSQTRQTKNINVIGNTVKMTTPAGAGINVGSCDTCGLGNVKVKNVNVSNNIVVGDGSNGTLGIQVRGAEDVSVVGNQISDIQTHGISTCCGNTGSLKISDNRIKNVNLLNGTAYAINLGNSGFTHHSLSDNTYSHGSYAATAFLNCSNTSVADVIVSGSSGDDTSIKTCLARVNQLATLPSEKTTDYTLALADRGNFIQMNCGAPCSLTVPPNASVGFNVGQVVCFEQTGTNAVTVAPGSGVTIRAFNSLILNGQYATGCIKQTATNTWQAVGNFQ